jgi:cytochrome c biogenesis protein CcmG/thiol:disulfide interchange protein DsbE
MARFKLFLPLMLFVPLALLLLKALQLDPQNMPSALLGKSMPAFELPALAEPARLLVSDDVRGSKALINVWATWCPSCRVEHPWLMTLAQQQGVRIIGLNYKDQRAAAMAWLQRDGNPYEFNIFDEQGRLGQDLGVYGAPETFVVDSAGVIRLKHVGVVNETVWREVILPVWQAIE